MSSGYVRIIESAEGNQYIKKDFSQRLEQGDLTRDENPKDHFCVYYMIFDKVLGEILIGKHKKSGLYLPPGGHIDHGETPEQALSREFEEEIGLDVHDFEINEKNLLTTTDIYNPNKQTCRKHFDIWYFINVRKSDFKLDIEKMSIEFDNISWLHTSETKFISTSNAVMEALEFLSGDIL